MLRLADCRTSCGSGLFFLNGVSEMTVRGQRRSRRFEENLVAVSHEQL